MSLARLEKIEYSHIRARDCRGFIHVPTTEPGLACACCALPHMVRLDEHGEHRDQVALRPSRGTAGQVAARLRHSSKFQPLLSTLVAPRSPAASAQASI